MDFHVVGNDLPASVVELCIESRTLMHLKTDIVTCFGAIPCLWIIHVFLMDEQSATNHSRLIPFRWFPEGSFP